MMQQFRQAVQQYRHNIYSYAYYYLRNREEAEDVTQEVLLRLWNNWHNIDMSLLQAWIIRVTRNASIDALRKRKNYRSHVVRDDEEYSMLEVATPEPRPDAVTEGKDYRFYIERALEQLDEPYRSLIILRELQEMKYEEISQAMDLPLNTVKVYLHRGRQMLRNILRKVMNNESAE